MFSVVNKRLRVPFYWTTAPILFLSFIDKSPTPDESIGLGLCPHNKHIIYG